MITNGKKKHQGFKFDVSSLCSTEGVFSANKLLWDRSSAAWPSSSGMSQFKHIVAGLELDPERVQSFRDPTLVLDLLGPESDPLFAYKRNDFKRQLQRMYTQLMRPDRFRHYMGVGSVLSGWQYLNGRENTIIDRLLNVGHGVDYIDNVSTTHPGTNNIMYGPDPLDPGGQSDWSDRVGYRTEILRNSKLSTFSYTKEELDYWFEAPFELSGSGTRSTAAKLLDDEREWRESGVQFYYELEMRIHPLLSQFLKSGEKYITPKEYGDVERSIYTPGEKWLDDPSLTFSFDNGEKKTVNQSAALETVYSVVAGRVGAGAPVVSMGPHQVENQWRLVSIRVLPEQHLFDALIDTQRFIDGFQGQDVEVRRQEAIELMMARIQSFENCIQDLSKIGFLHLGVSSVNMFQGTVWKPGKGGQGSIVAPGPKFTGAGRTYVRDFRPRNVTLVRLPEDVCSVIMRTILFLDLYERDTKRELALLHISADLLGGQITRIIVAKTINAQMEHFMMLLESAWDFHYKDATRYSGEVETLLPSTPSIPSKPVEAPVAPVAPIAPTNIPPEAIKTDLRRSEGPKPPLPPVYDEKEKEKESSNETNDQKVDTRNNPILWAELLYKGTSGLKPVPKPAPKQNQSKMETSLSDRIDEAKRRLMLTRQESNESNASDGAFEDDKDSPPPPRSMPTLGPVEPAKRPTPRPNKPKQEEAEQAEQAEQVEQVEQAEEQLDLKQMKKAILNRRSSQQLDGSDTESAFSKLYSASNVAFDAYTGQQFDFEIDRIQYIFAGQSTSQWKPPRDSVVLAVRVTHRLYELCRNIVFKATNSNAKNETQIKPATVRNFCGPGPGNGETKTSLELAAMLLRKLANT